MSDVFSNRSRHDKHLSAKDKSSTVVNRARVNRMGAGAQIVDSRLSYFHTFAVAIHIIHNELSLPISSEIVAVTPCQSPIRRVPWSLLPAYIRRSLSHGLTSVDLLYPESTATPSGAIARVAAAAMKALLIPC